MTANPTEAENGHQFVDHVLDAAAPDQVIRFRNRDTDETWDVARVEGRIVKVHHRTDELFAVDRDFVRVGLLSPTVDYDRVTIEDSRIDPATVREQYDCDTSTASTNDD